MMWAYLVAILLAAPVLLFCISQYFTVAHDSGEPPLVSSRIPVVGHLLGLLANSHSYFHQLSVKNGLPIFRVDIVTFPIYVVNSAKLVSGIQRNSKSLTFEPFVYWALKSMAGVSKQGIDAISKPHVSSDMFKVIRAALYPGSALNEMNRKMVLALNELLDDLKNYEHRPVKLSAWIQHALTQATTFPVYGNQNPYTDRIVEDAFWLKEVELMNIMIPVAWLRRLLARRGLEAIKTGTNAFVKYYNNNHHLDGASEMTRHRFRDLQAAGVSIRDIAAAEFLNTGATIGNSVPSTFWTVYTIYSRPALLAELRVELDAHLVTTWKGTEITYTFDAAVLKDSCPLMLSVFQEVLRTRSRGANVRYVEEDTWINGQYLLKKGAFVQMPSSTIHQELRTWGPDAGDFDPYRFITKGKRPESAAMRSFGGGDHLCPGRFFATTEINAFAAMLVMRYDLVPVEGEWTEPDINHKMFTPNIRPPLQDISTFVTPRKGLEEGEWILKLSDGTGEFDLASG